MNYAKIQQDLISAHFKINRPHIMVGEYEGDVALSHDGVALYIIPQSLCLIDYKKVNNGDLFNVAYVINDDMMSHLVTAKMTGVTITHYKGCDWDATEFITEDGKKYYFNAKKYFKYFHKTATYKIYHRKSSVYCFIYENDELVGVVCGARYEED